MNSRGIRIILSNIDINHLVSKNTMLCLVKKFSTSGQQIPIVRHLDNRLLIPI